MILFSRIVLRFALILLVAVLVLFAVFITLLRAHTGNNEYIKTIVEVQLEKALHQEVFIEHLEVDSSYLLPKIYLRNIHFSSVQDTDSGLSVSEALIDLDWTQTLRQGKITLNKVELRGIDIQLYRDEKGNIEINQGWLLPLLVAQSNDRTSSYNVELDISDASVRWKDDRLKVDYLFSSIAISARSSASSSRIQASIQLPAALGNSVLMAAEVKGSMYSLLSSDIRFYLRGSDLHLHEIGSHFRHSELLLPADLSIETWGKLSQGAVTGLQGSVSFAGLEQRPGGLNQEFCASKDYIRSGNARFNWQTLNNGWKLQLGDLAIVSQENTWPTTQLTVIRSIENRSIRTTASAGYLETGALCNSLALIPGVQQRIKQLAGDFAARLVLRNAGIVIQQRKEQVPHFGIHADEFTLHARHLNEGFAVDGLSGSLSMNDTGGVFRPSQKSMKVQLPKLYAEQPLMLSMEGDLRWEKVRNDMHFYSDQLRMFNDEIEFINRFSLQSIMHKPYIDWQMAIIRGTVPLAAKYFPQHAQTTQTKQWLTQSLVAGEIPAARALLRGELSQFPFADQPGVFEVVAEAKAGRLEYRPGWPTLDNINAEVRIEDERLVVVSDSAQILNSKVRQAEVTIESFLNPVLSIKGETQGAVSDLLIFLGESKMVNLEHSILGEFEVAGEARLELEIKKSISAQSQQPLQLDGKLEFLDSIIDIPPLGLTLNNITGQAEFGQQGISANDIRTQVFDRAVRIDASPEYNGRSRLSLAGSLDMGRYIDERFPYLSGVVRGESLIMAEIFIPPVFDLGGADRVSYQLMSNLTGTEIVLPQPLGKSAQKSQDFRLEYDANNHELRIALGDTLQLEMNEQPGGKFSLAQVYLGPGPHAGLPDRVALVSGSIEQLNVNEWLSYMSSRSGASAIASTALPSVHVDVGELKWGSLTARQLRLIGLQEADAYRIGIDSSIARGTVLVPPLHAQPERQVELDFDYLHVPHTTRTKGDMDSGLKHPGQLPLFQLKARKLGVGDYSFKDAVIKTKRLPGGIAFDEISLQAQDLKVSARGSWKELSKDSSNTEFVITLDSIDVEDSLEDLGFVSAIGKGEAKIKADVRWGGSPAEFDLASAWADVDVNIWDGVIKEVDPGAGRLIALINLGAIGRRLSLDFKDIVDKGFTFDSIIGGLSLRGGHLNIHNLKLASSSADIVINGETHLIDKTYDQKLRVTPKLSGSLPVAGALLGGPVVGAAIILADQVSKAVGGDINKVSTTHYALTGTWEAPDLTRTSAPETRPTSQSQPVQSLPP